MKHTEHRTQPLPITFLGPAAAISLLLLGVSAHGQSASRGGGAAQSGHAFVEQGGVQTYRPDTDGDGILDLAEVFLGTDPLDVDTDGDGFSDTEELARGSSPVDTSSLPGISEMAIGMVATDYDGELHIFSALYFEDGTLTGKTFEFGALYRGTLALLSPNRYESNLETIPSNDPDQLIVVVEAILSPTPLHRAGSMSFFGTLSGGRNPAVQAADAVNLVSVGGVIFERGNEFLGANQSMGAGVQGIPLGSGSTGVHRPLGGTRPLGQTWVSGQVCAQSMTVVGVGGATVTQEVQEASCQSGFDGVCDPTACSSSVGSTIEILDPLGLLGG